MPVAHVSSSESSVGAGSPRIVSVISRLRRVAGSMRTNAPALLDRERLHVRDRRALRVLGVVEQSARGGDGDRVIRRTEA